MKLTRPSEHTLRIEQTQVLIAFLLMLGSLALMVSAVSGWIATGYQDTWPLVGRCAAGLFGVVVAVAFVQHSTITFNKTKGTFITTRTTAFSGHENVERPLDCIQSVTACTRRDDLVLTINWDGKPQEFRLRYDEGDKQKAINIAIEVESWLRAVDSNATKV